MIRTQVYLPDELFRDLKLIASNKEVRFSDLIRKGARAIVEDHKKKRVQKPLLRTLIGAGSQRGPKDLSRRIDYYLYGGGSKWANKKSS